MTRIKAALERPPRPAMIRGMAQAIVVVPPRRAGGSGAGRSARSGRPAPGELLVDVAAAGVNFIEIYQREGRPPYDTAPLPYVPGVRGGGDRRGAGSRASRASRSGTGSRGRRRRAATPTQVLVPADKAVPVPEGVDLQTAAGGAAAGADRPLPDDQRARRGARRRLRRARRGRRCRPAAHPAGQAAGRDRGCDHLDAGEGRARAWRRRRPRRRLRRLRRGHARGHRRGRRAGGLRRSRERPRSTLRSPRCGRAASWCSTAVPAAPSRRSSRSASPPAGRCGSRVPRWRTSPRRARSSSPAPTTSSPGSPRASSRSASAGPTPSSMPSRRTRTSRAACTTGKLLLLP